MSISVPFKPNSTYPRSYVLTQPYHNGRVYRNLPVPHLALDMAGYMGQPVYAASSGRVYQASWNAGGWAIGGGYSILIDHYGPGRRLARSSYSHLKSMTVRPGQYVLRGQLIGYADNTGNSSGSHVHFAFCEIYNDPRVYSNWKWIDPYRYMRAHSFQNGSRGNGNLIYSQHTYNTVKLGVFANGRSRPTNIRSGPYLSSARVATITRATLFVYLGSVTGSNWNGSRVWDKLYDVSRRRVVYVHTTLGLWVL